jgi:hypothetical protein
MGARDAVHGPFRPACLSTLRPELTAAVLVGEGHAPVVAVLLAGRQKARSQTSPSRTPKDVNHGHPSIYPCKRATYWGPRQWP